MKICFDMDGTIANLYGVDNWLEYLIAENTTPYEIAKPLINLSLLARYLNKIQQNGNKITIISWCSKCGSDEYNKAVKEAKINWLTKHLPSVCWDEIIIVPYGTPKQNYCRSSYDILFDDEEQNRKNWTGRAFDETMIFEILKGFKPLYN